MPKSKKRPTAVAKARRAARRGSEQLPPLLVPPWDMYLHADDVEDAPAGVADFAASYPWRLGDGGDWTCLAEFASGLSMDVREAALEMAAMAAEGILVWDLESQSVWKTPDGRPDPEAVAMAALVGLMKTRQHL